MAGVPRAKLTKTVAPITVALTMVDLWQRLPQQQRRLITQQVRKHGPRLARQAIEAQLNRKRRLR